MGIAIVAAAAAIFSSSGFTYTMLVSGPSGAGAASSLSSQPSNFPSVSGDGRYVAFLSPSPDLVAGDTNGQTDAFVRDVVTNTTSMLSVNGSVLENGSAASVLAAGDGRHFVITTPASNLSSGDLNGATDVFLRDTVARTTVLVSATNTGATGIGPSVAEGVSTDGHYVVFASVSNNLVPNDTNAVSDVFVRDTVAGTTARVSLDSTGAQLASPSFDADISATGRYVAFVSAASNVIPGVGNGFAQVYVRDVVTGIVTLASRTSGGGPAAGDSRAPSVSADGHAVVFESNAADLVSGDTNGVSDIFGYDANTGTVMRVSSGLGGAQADAASTLSYPQHKSIDDAGCHIIFQSDADNLAVADLNHVTDVFIWDCADGSIRRVSLHADDVHQSGFGSAHAAISADGNYAAFTSREPLQTYDTNNHPDVYERFVGAQPIISSMSPNAVSRGTTATLTINGFGFTQRFSAILPTGVTLASAQWISSTKVTITVVVASTAVPQTSSISFIDLGTGPGASAGAVAFVNLTVI